MYYGQTYRQMFMPYCLIKLESGKWVIVNRHYKPLGTLSRDKWYNYEEYSVHIKWDRRHRKKLADLGATSESPEEFVALYNDATNPERSKMLMQRYMDKLAILAKLGISI
jgi:hypothetical protein